MVGTHATCKKNAKKCRIGIYFAFPTMVCSISTAISHFHVACTVEGVDGVDTIMGISLVEMQVLNDN